MSGSFFRFDLLNCFENTSKNVVKRFTRGIPVIPKHFEIFGIEVTMLTKIEKYEMCNRLESFNNQKCSTFPSI